MANPRLEQYQDIIARLYPNFNHIEKNQIQTFTCTFSVTDDCNLRCSYCYQINKGHHVMTFDTAKKFIDLLLNNDESTQQYIDTRNSMAIVLEFVGGEPFLQTQLIDKICDYFYTQTIIKNHPWQYYWQISITSNGTLYFNPEVQKFIQKWQKNLSLSISLDGNKELHDSCRVFPDGTGSYDIVVKAVEHYMQNYNEILGNKMTLSPQNINFTSQAIISLINKNYHYIFLNCVYEKGWTYKHATILYNELKIVANYILDNNLENTVRISMFDDFIFKPMDANDRTNWCGGNGQMLAVDWEGNIYPCIRYTKTSLGDDASPVIIGDVNNGLLYNAKCKNCINLLRQVDRLTQSSDECINCTIAYGCAWCQAYNYQDSHGDFNHRATYICCMHKALSLANCYFWNLFYWKHKDRQRFQLWLSDKEALKIISEDELWKLKTLAYPFINK